MGTFAIPRIKQAIEGRLSCVLPAALLVCVVLSGCAVNRVRILSHEPTATPIKTNDVKFFSSFKDIDGPWQLEGMISAYTLPIMSNTVEKRVALIRDEAAGLGIDSVIGLQHPASLAVRRVGRSVGLLARAGTAGQRNANAMPKFIVCLPPMSYLEEELPNVRPPAGDLDDFLLELTQFYLSYYKGYYVYRCNAPGVSKDSILHGNVSPRALSEPIGVAPDFALTCSVGSREAGFLYIGSKDSQALLGVRQVVIRMALIDLSERRIVWEDVAGIPAGWLSLRAPPVIRDFTSDDKIKDELGLATNSSLGSSIITVPAVKGFVGADTDLPKWDR